MIEMLNALDEYTGGRFRHTIRRRQELFRSDILLLTRNYSGLYSLSRLGVNLFKLKEHLLRIIRRWLSFL